eukprot:jgi/Botrbrau1/15616/Bobra.4_1s0004.1
MVWAFNPRKKYHTAALLARRSEVGQSIRSNCLPRSMVGICPSERRPVGRCCKGQSQVVWCSYDHGHVHMHVREWCTGLVTMNMHVHACGHMRFMFVHTLFLTFAGQRACTKFPYVCWRVLYQTGNHKHVCW